MSFHWNLSSDEEGEAWEWHGKLDTPENTIPPRPREITPGAGDDVDGSSGVARKSQSTMDEFYFSEEEDEEEIEWEDADDVAEDLDTKPAAKPSLLPVTIDMNRPPERQETKKRKRALRRRVYRFHSLPSDLQSLLLHIQQCHLLALTSRAVQLSRCCSDWELMHVAQSLLPLDENLSETPTEAEVRAFALWYFYLVNRTTERRRRAYAANVAAGAAITKRGREQHKRTKRAPNNPYSMGVTRPDRLLQACSYLSSTNDENPQLSEQIDLSGQDKTQLLVAMVRSKGWRARYVTVFDPVGCDLNADHPLFLMNTRNVFRLLSKSADGTCLPEKTEIIPSSFNFGNSQRPSRELGWVEILCKITPTNTQKSKPRQHRWVHVDPSNSLVDQPGAVETLFESVKNDGYEPRQRKRIIAFALAAEHIDAKNQYEDEDESNHVRLTDVTPRYTNSWSQSLQLRSVKKGRSDSVSDNKWWTETLKIINSFHHSRTRQCIQSISPAALQARGSSQSEAIEVRDSCDESSVDRDGSLHPHEAIDLDEKAELLGSATNEAIPTSKAAFNNHPLYAIPAVLNVNEVLAPDAKSRICGLFKGAPVYRRSDVHIALVAKKWLYQGRKVKQDEMGKPVKRVKARTKAAPKGFQPLRSYGVGKGNDGSEEARQKEMQKATKPNENDDGMDNLYGHWQTVPWSPIPVGPNDPIPVNEYNNIELELLNPGLEHLEQPRISKVAKQLGIPYAPCLLGFEGHGGNRTPSIRGIVVHEHNASILREAHAEFMSGALEQEYEERKTRILKRWKKLIVGVLTKERLEREYG